MSRGFSQRAAKRRTQAVTNPTASNNGLPAVQPATPRQSAASQNALTSAASTKNVNVRGSSPQHSANNGVGAPSYPPIPFNSQQSTTTAFGKEEYLILMRIFWSAALLIFVILYTLNQNKQLPRGFSRLVTKMFFWPTIPFTFISRAGNWMTVVDETVMVGAAPFGFAGIPKKIRNKKEFECTGVINMCEEYRGPIQQYQKLGIKQLWLPTPDHFEPSFEDYKNAVSFILAFEQVGQHVYVHCRSGHGRSAAVAFAWMLYKQPNLDPQTLNSEMLKKRDVRKTLWQQPNIRKFRSWVLDGGRVTPATIDVAGVENKVKRGQSIDTIRTSIVSTVSETTCPPAQTSIEMTNMSLSRVQESDA